MLKKTCFENLKKGLKFGFMTAILKTTARRLN